jgi:tRNA(fMet)-specific endonuclease VapC
MKYLLDTNICIYIIKKKPASVRAKFEEQVVGDIGVSSITIAELYYGVQKSQHPEKNRLALEQFLIPLAIADFDYYAAMISGNIRAILEQQGTPIGGLDLLIAAHALSLNLTLVTNNIKEFKRIPELKVENWVSETS